MLLIVSASSQPTVQLVAQAIGGPTAEDDIAAAFNAGVIEGSGGLIRLTHPLLATVLHSESPGQSRRDIHRRLAALAADQEERARHLALAARDRTKTWRRSWRLLPDEQKGGERRTPPPSSRSSLVS